jgi:hypothetical protein
VIGPGVEHIGGLNRTHAYTNNITHGLLGHPVLLNPFGIEDDELDNWGWSAHGHFNTSTLPGGSTKILNDVTSGNPVLIEGNYGSGYFIATGQTIEWNQYYNYTKLLVNLILYNPEYYNPTINITSPTSSSIEEVSDPLQITWTSTGSTSNIRMELLKDGVGVDMITTNTPNDGVFLWTISPQPNSTQYQVKIFDADWPAVYAISDFFEIQDPRTITVVSPSSGISWTKGKTYTIKWSTTGTITDVTIDIYASGFLILDISNGTTTNNGSFVWTIPYPLDNYTDHIIRISDAIDAGMYDESGVFKIVGPSSGIPGFDLFILLTFIVGVSFIIGIRKWKNTNIVKG